MFDVDVDTARLREPPADKGDGYVELCGRLDAAGGWLVCGWARRGWSEQTSGSITLLFPGATLTGCATTCFFNRDDLQGGAVGFLLFLRCPAGDGGAFAEMRVDIADPPLRLLAAGAALPRPEETLRTDAERMLRSVSSERARALLRAWLARPRFAGQDTLAAAGAAIRLELEAVLPAPPAAVVLIGWLDDPVESIAAIQLRCGDRLREFDSSTWVRLPRQDVQADLCAAADDFGLDRGFLAYFPGICAPGEPLYLQIEFNDGTVAYRPLPRPSGAGLGAMRQVLGAFHLRHLALSRAMSQVIGPAIAALNMGWLRTRPTSQDLRFGTPASPIRCSVIVRLSGRADALEWQLALLSEAPHADVEFLYVLDDANLRDAVIERAETCLARFGLPFRLLVMDRFVGQAPCDNHAAASATGDLLCFLSPAAMPDDPAWLDRLLETLEQPPASGATGVGAVGARLRTAAGADWQDKVRGGGPVIDVTTIDGDCLAIRRAVLRELGGFHEAYAIGGLADDDLCQKLRWAGLRCVQRQDVSLTVLNGAAEATPLWLRNLAHYNAWQRDRRWPEVARTASNLVVP